MVRSRAFDAGIRAGGGPARSLSLVHQTTVTTVVIFGAVIGFIIEGEFIVSASKTSLSFDSAN
jgi:hypothetical protein